MEAGSVALAVAIAGTYVAFGTMHEIAIVCEIRSAQDAHDPAAVVITSAGEYTVPWSGVAEFLPQIKVGGTYRLGQEVIGTRLKEVQAASADKAEGKCP